MAALRDSGETLDPETASRLLSVPGSLGRQGTFLEPPAALAELIGEREAGIRQAIGERNGRFLEAEAEKLEGWADDLKLGLEREIKDLDRQIKEARRTAAGAPGLEEKLAGQKRIKVLEAQRKEKRRSLFDAQDEIDARRDALIREIEAKLAQRSELKHLFTIRWNLH